MDTKSQLQGDSMNDRINALSDTVNVTLHKTNFTDNHVSYAKVKRNTAYIGNIVSMILEKNKVLDRETLLYSAGLLRNAILDLLKSGKAVDLLEMGILYIKPSGSISSDTPDISDVPEMTLGFTPSDLAVESVKDITVGADVSIENVPQIDSLFDLHLKQSGQNLSIGHTVRISGSRLKIAGDEDKTGVYFAPCSENGTYDYDSTTWKSIGMDNVIDNTTGKVLFNIPQDFTSGTYRLIVKTAYGSGNRINKTIRTGVYQDIVKLA